MKKKDAVRPPRVNAFSSMGNYLNTGQVNKTVCTDGKAILNIIGAHKKRNVYCKLSSIQTNHNTDAKLRNTFATLLERTC